MADFDPTLTAALEAVTAQRDTMTMIIRQVRARTQVPRNVPFPDPRRQPSPACSQALTPHTINDMMATFNRVLDSIRDGSATENSVKRTSGTSVQLANLILEPANVCLSERRPPLDEKLITAGWLQILSSFNGMSEKDKKKLSRHLDKKVRW